MSFTPFAFTKNWENPNDFPTYEEEEAQVRADMQLLYDELKNGLNKLMAELERHDDDNSRPGGASQIGVDGITTLPNCPNVQAALALLAYQITQATAGEIPEYSLTANKLSRKTDDGGAAVTRDAIVAGAVGTDELAAGAVTGEKTNFSTGLAVGGTLTQSGAIVLTEEVSYGTEAQRPASPVVGQLYFQKVES